MAIGIIHCGVCGFTINVKAVVDDSQSNSRRSKMIKLEITSDCPNYQKIAKELTEVDAYKEIFYKVHMGRVYEVFAKYSPHPSCPSTLASTPVKPLISLVFLPTSKVYQIRSYYKLLSALSFW